MIMGLVGTGSHAPADKTSGKTRALVLLLPML